MVHILFQVSRGCEFSYFLRQINDGVVSVMIIGNNNVFEVGCRSSALKIGDNNVLESKCFVGRSVVLSNGCIVGAGCRYGQ